VEKMNSGFVLGDKFCFPYPLAVLGIFRVAEFVVFSNDEMHRVGIEAREETVQIIRGPCKVSEVIEDVTLLDSGVESL
jgi:hypothetical protein